MSEPIVLDVVNRDGESLFQVEYDTVEEMLRAWPYAEESAGYWSTWVGGQ